ncbi:FecCD family ABC transporter permease [Swingsia samuiensis]|uniref:Iron ABC transporter permease n=1 Tax=Swingsia samuiensis TaxID=1293412 RepID=A0A4Y6UN37_9PROT|nr:iron ABC transporter permease [Swingsia samuiensis]QDH17767.1 iron ABC transporter permease [Swingsia samuiensis]
MKFIILLGMSFLLVGGAEFTIGTAHLSCQQTIHGFLAGPYSHDIIARIIWLFRIPRFFLAFLAGVGLAASGSLLQGVTRNSLADPFLFGLSSGAAAGAVAMIVFANDILGIWTTQLGAICGSLCSTGAFFLLAFYRRNVLSSDRIILSGLSVSFIFSTITNFFIFYGDRNTAQSVLFWTIGSFSSAQWSNIPIALLATGIIILYGIKNNNQIVAMLAGKETAFSLGVNVQYLYVTTLCVTSFSCALLVSLCGPIGFVGLIVPHLVRLFYVRSFRKLFLYSSFAGGILTTVADIISKIIIPSQEVPVGIIISAIGSVFLMLMLLKGKGHNSAS